MSKLIRLTWMAVAVALGGCDVQVHDETPTEYPANHDIGMYEIKAAVTRDALVTPGSVFMFALGGKERVELSPNRDGSEWHGLYSVRCRSSFPLQFLAVWKLQGLATKQKLEPPQPREVKLIEPPLTRAVSIDTAGKMPKGGWEGGVPYRIATAPNTRITAAHIEPLSQDPAEVAAAKPISVVGSFPVDVPCGTPTEVRVASTAQRAHGNLVIDTDHPAVAHWQTRIEFLPK
ncbi:MAG: hypothetical protein E6K49_02660 [Gammaproteobacteria bacterium]|nr:MAG: hypothetical protein E6K49_02660 [Gammaproteobacteria bacterium]